MNLVVVKTDKDGTILAQKLPKQRQPRVHHAKPTVVAIKRLTLFANNLAQPLSH
jgi:hypothetical protein